MIDLAASIEQQRHHQDAEGCCKTVSDLERYRTLIQRVRPDGIVECGSYSGKSACWLACVSGAPVVSLDVSDLPTRDLTVMGDAARLGVTFVQGRSTDPRVQEIVRRWASGKQRIMLSLDSDHSKATVLGELEAYAGYVPVGGYAVVEDGLVRWLPEQWAYYQGSPLDATEAWLAAHPEWEADMELEDMLPDTQHPGGWLRRLR